MMESISHLSSIGVIFLYEEGACEVGEVGESCDVEALGVVDAVFGAALSGTGGGDCLNDSRLGVGEADVGVGVRGVEDEVFEDEAVSIGGCKFLGENFEEESVIESTILCGIF